MAVILVVDDDKVDRLTVRRSMASLQPDIRVDEADSALAARKCVETERYDCIFLDYNIPGGDGMSVLRFIRERGISTPVVMLTGHGDEQLAVDLMKAGATDYMNKANVSAERLGQVYRNAVRLAEAHAESLRNEADLHALAERLRLATESSAVGTWDYDPETDRSTWDERSGEILGIVPGQVETFTDFSRAVHPDDRQRLAQARAAALDPVGNGDYRTEYRIVLPDGRLRWIDARGRVLFEGEGESRKPLRFIGTVMDISERKETEHTLREEAQIVDTLQRIGGTLTAELKIDRIVQVVTDEATKLTNAQFGAFFYNVIDDKGEAFTLYTISGVPREAFSKFPMPRNTAVFSPTFHGTEIVRSADIRVDARYGKNEPYFGMPKGHLPVVSYLAVPVKSNTGEVIGGLFFGHEKEGVFTETSERLAIGIAGWAAVAMDNARLYALEQKSRTAAEEANAAKSTFLATMSHELRTPLNAIGGYAQLVETGVYGPVAPAQVDAMQRITRAQSHLLALINDILNFAKVEAGKMKLSMQAIAVADAMLGIGALIEPQSRAKNITYSLTKPETDAFINVDRERFQQIMLNLLTNAVKFTLTGGKIEVGWATHDKLVEIYVRDSGIGIPADKLEKVFEPFVQVDRYRTSTTEGVGLGLAISRELARAMGGDLSATSKVEKGSTFTLSLPKL
ncbi:MAG: response regulator [Gemmatimonadaceae bacterium]|nr:response regulator [Gemmatimonadaceae bacterium]